MGAKENMMKMRKSTRAYVFEIKLSFKHPQVAMAPEEFLALKEGAIRIN
jgi:hypothetical protein